jgi:hypothetical protein
MNTLDRIGDLPNPIKRGKFFLIKDKTDYED